MGFFSRNKEAVESGPSADVPFDALRRPPRATRKSRAPADSHFDAPPPLDPAETAKTRARRRLIGAIALALAAIVFVPMLFDRAPGPPADDIALQIPDRDTPFEGRRGVPDASRGPLKGATDLPTVTPAAPAASVVSPAPPSDVTTSAAPPAEGTDKAIDAPVDQQSEKQVGKRTDPTPDVAPPARTADKSPAKAAPTVAEKSKPATTAPTDDPKALAALSGKPEAPQAEAAGKGYVVQVAAFSAAEKARALRDQLVANGIKSYTESVSTTQGLRTRVRLGPFASRDAADHAKQKLKTMKLDGSVVPL